MGLGMGLAHVSAPMICGPYRGRVRVAASKRRYDTRFLTPGGARFGHSDAPIAAGGYETARRPPASRSLVRRHRNDSILGTEIAELRREVRADIGEAAR